MKLNRGEVHVWSANLELWPQEQGGLERTLSADEIARAGRFYFEPDRRNFIARHGILRAILATYLNAEPSALRFLSNQFGKPRLESSADARSLSFNLSHSGAMVLVAAAIDREVGVDVQLIDGAVSSDEVADRFFSANEVARLKALPEALKLLRFFDYWARKEAYIKARGMGLSIPLDSFDVSSDQGESKALIDDGNSSRESIWKIEDLSIDSRYAAAISAPERDWQVVRLVWQPGMRPPD